MVMFKRRVVEAAATREPQGITIPTINNLMIICKYSFIAEAINNLINSKCFINKNEIENIKKNISRDAITLLAQQ